MPGETNQTHRLIRGKLSKFLNLGLCVAGIVFIVIGVFKSTLLLYVGCALIGAAIGGFIRSRLPMSTMIPSTGVHFVYRSELQRNLQAYEDGLQTFVVMHSQQPCGIGQKKINQYTTITKYPLNMILLNNDSVDRVSVVSALTERTEPNESCCIICLIHFKIGQEVRKLPCQHIYHINCIDKWLKINRLCPTCRSDITLPSSVKKFPTSGDIEVHAELNVIGSHGNSDETTSSGVEDGPCTSQGVSVAPSNSSVREIDIGDDNEEIRSLASVSNDVVIHLEIEKNAVAN